MWLIRRGSQVLVLAFLCTVACSAQAPAPVPVKPRSAHSAVSVQELAMPAKAHREFEKGTQLLLEGNISSSIEHLIRSVEQSPRYYGPYHNLALAYLQLGRTEEALKNFQKAIDVSNAGFAPSLYGLAMLLYRNKEFTAAEPLVQRALVLEPSAAGKYCLGTMQFALGRVSEAERSAREAIGLDPAMGDSYFLLARIHEAQQNSSSVIDDVRTYFRLSPNGSMKADALALLYRAQQAQSGAQASALLR